MNAAVNSALVPAVVPIAAGIACAVSLLLVVLMLALRWHWALDHPNERSLHSTPVPRTGGLALMLGVAGAIAAILALGGRVPLWSVCLPAALLMLLSLLDDRHNLPVWVRLPAHLTLALWFGLSLVLAGGGASWPWLPVIVLGVAGFANLYNFMDGANGLAGGMAVCGFATYGYALFGADGVVDPGLAALCFSLAAAAAGFLCCNLSGRIFMGDAGSVPLGFLAAALGLKGWTAGYWPVWFGPLVFAPFVLDGGVTLVRRVLRRERFWEAHREHYYQRLVRMGWSHARMAGAAYALMAACAAAALLALQVRPAAQAGIFATIALLFAGIALAIDRRWQRFNP
jgi:UDP-N-acetylmuramyl pentapeptide phosphotransferase/UDP-N-acetylglucosamine-1-phosphate transferase